MRVLILKDKTISDEELNVPLVELKLLYKENAHIDMQVTVREHDYTDQSGVMRAGFDALPYGYLDKHVKAIHQRDNYAFDHIIFLVHEDNWRPTKKIWGENFSNFWYTYHVEVCRYDADNPANTLGTLYHEIHHSHDALIQTMLGIKVEPFVEVKDWDTGITHGGERPWRYIRYNENQESLQMVKTWLKEAYLKHYHLHLKEKVSLLTKVVRLAEQLLVLKRQLLIKSNQKCLSPFKAS